ncbi:Quinone oxidoreductase-like protein 2 [Trachymyrmex septentrionalis]|uniref:Quinone oxidoreductase-like protein 2 n=1 Tax=Trachymyrmex septentrionalis TaxID=34720 RepID=A0A195FX26_9HYME|nr:PREDICTED: quinone oxidoreductase-like protein 2 [Trachymyrmex septentrionalis]KYN44872.1 Quinone oxidoreductase-like protein 2 [Trachymyrmex septentrionalis]
MKLFADSRAVIEKNLKIFKRYNKLDKLATSLERIRKIVEPMRSTQTGRKLRAAVLHAPCNLKLDYIPEKEIQQTQVRVDVHFCGLTGSDVLLWRGKHRSTPKSTVVLGFEVSGTILEMGRLAHEQTGYQIGEEVIVHNYPVCGGLAESCLAHYRDVFRLMRRVSLKNAAAVTDDYFSALLAIGRRARIQRNECLLVNAKHSRSALAVIDLATRVFGAKPIAICDDARRAQLCADLGATVICRNERCLPYKLKKISGKEEVRVMIETKGEPCFQNVVKCLEHDGLIAVLGSARNERSLDFSFVPINCMMFVVAAEHYKIADTLVYRETMQHVLDYKSECAIRPRVSAIFGLNHINDAFNYYAAVPSGKVLIDLKDHNRLTLYDES